MTISDAFPLTSVSHLESPASWSATTIDSLIEGITAADDRVLFHHVTRIPLRYENSRDLPANDFSRWVRTALQDPETAEYLAFAGSPSLMPIDELRDTLRKALERVPPRRRKQEAPEEAAFHFLRAVSVTAPLGVVLMEPNDLVVNWASVDRGALFYHLIEAPLLGPHSASLYAWLQSRGSEGLARSAQELASTGRPLSVLQRELGSRWRRRLITNRLVKRLESSEESRQADAREVMARLAGRLRGAATDSRDTGEPAGDDAGAGEDLP